MANIVEKLYTQRGRDMTFPSNFQVYNLGCGKQKYPGVIGVDLLPIDGVDMVQNLDETPWPIPDSSADVLLLFHTLEHLTNLPRVMEEMYRILKPGGRIVIEVPYFRHVGAFQDPTHQHFFTSNTMAYFCEAEPGKRPPGPLYADVSFKQIDFWFGWPARSKNPLIQMLKDFCRKNHNFYDRYISILFPSKIITYELEAIK